MYQDSTLQKADRVFLDVPAIFQTNRRGNPQLVDSEGFLSTHNTKQEPKLTGFASDTDPPSAAVELLLIAMSCSTSKEDSHTHSLKREIK